MNEDKKNYFIVSRGLLYSNRWLSEKPFTRGQAWIDLFGLACHTRSFFRVRGIKVWLERGQLGYSQLTLAKRWGWSRGKISRFLKELENDGDISQRIEQQITTIITIVNYNKWQLNSTTSKTTDGQQTDNKQDTYKKIKKDKNEKNIILADKSTGKEINDLIDLFKSVNPTHDRLFAQKPQRQAVERLLKKLGREKLEQIIASLPKSNSMDYAPRIFTPYELEKKLGALIAFVQKQNTTNLVIKI